MNPFKEKIESEIETAQAEVDELTIAIEDLNEEMEEYQLRFLAKEFEEDEFSPKRDTLDSAISEKQNLIQEHNESIAQFNERLAFIAGEPIETKVEDIDEEADEVAEEAEEEAEEEIEEAEEKVEEIDEESDEDELAYDDQPIRDSEEPVPGIDAEDQDFPEDDQLEEPVESDEEEEPMVSGDDEEYIWSSPPVLDVIEGDFAGESYPMNEDRITLGRGPNNDIKLSTDTSVSRHHSQLTQENDRYLLVDLESSNGTSVNGSKITRIYLRPNDEITIGCSKIIVRPSEE